jgi:hypothetical protein
MKESQITIILEYDHISQKPENYLKTGNVPVSGYVG